MIEGDWSAWLLGRELEDAAEQRKVIDRLLDLAELRPGQRLLDLGAGHGQVALAAAERMGAQGRITCVDAEVAALAEARRRAGARGLTNVDFVAADAVSLPLEDASVDAATAKSVLYTLEDRAGAMAELSRVLRPGGRLALFEPLLRWESVWQSPQLEGLAESLESARHPAFQLDALEMMRLAEEAGFGQVQEFTWHADVTRSYVDAGEVLREWEGLLPGELSLTDWWRRSGVTEEELADAAESLARHSMQAGFRDLMPCIFVGASKRKAT